MEDVIKQLEDVLKRVKQLSQPETLPPRKFLGTFNKFWIFPRKVFNRAKNKKEWKWFRVKNVDCFENYRWANTFDDSYIEYFFEYEIG